MREDIVRIDGYGWDARYITDFTCDGLRYAVKALESIGCEGEAMDRALSNMRMCLFNTGLTYSNKKTKKSVVIVYRTVTTDQFINSLSHETHHLCTHISEEYGIDPYSEEMSTLFGDTMQKLTNIIYARKKRKWQR